MRALLVAPCNKLFTCARALRCFIFISRGEANTKSSGRTRKRTSRGRGGAQESERAGGAGARQKANEPGAHKKATEPTAKRTGKSNLQTRKHKITIQNNTHYTNNNTTGKNAAALSPPRRTGRLFPLTKHSPLAAATCACSNENKHGEEVRHDAFSNMRRRLHPNSNDYEHNSPASASSAQRSLLVRRLAAPRNAAQLHPPPPLLLQNLRNGKSSRFREDWTCDLTSDPYHCTFHCGKWTQRHFGSVATVEKKSVWALPPKLGSLRRPTIRPVIPTTTFDPRAPD